MLAQDVLSKKATGHSIRERRIRSEALRAKTDSPATTSIIIMAASQSCMPAYIWMRGHQDMHKEMHKSPR